jgi:signal transduction histidine kinase
MNPLPRFLVLALFVVLAALVALLAAPAWRTRRDAPLPRETASAAAGGGQAARAARLAALPPRLALALALVGLGLAGALALVLTLRPARPTDSRPPFTAARSEIGTLAKLAETSVAQGAELSRERDVRRRAQEDAQLKQQLLTQSFDDRVRLGRDLHDGIIQSLYAVGLTLESLRTLLKTDPAAAEQRLEETRTALNTTIRDVRAYITGLAPENLRRAGFAQSLETVLADLGASRAVEFDIKVDDEATALLTPDQTLEALQIAREAVSNALRHGGATRITLRLHLGDGEVGLLVQDNGCGFDAAAPHAGGHGLGNMQARAERLGARLRVTSHPRDGTRVVLTLPALSAPA